MITQTIKYTLLPDSISKDSMNDWHSFLTVIKDNKPSAWFRYPWANINADPMTDCIVFDSGVIKLSVEQQIPKIFIHLFSEPTEQDMSAIQTWLDQL